MHHLGVYMLHFNLEFAQTYRIEQHKLGIPSLAGKLRIDSAQTCSKFGFKL